MVWKNQLVLMSYGLFIDESKFSWSNFCYYDDSDMNDNDFPAEKPQIFQNQKEQTIFNNCKAILSRFHLKKAQVAKRTQFIAHSLSANIKNDIIVSNSPLSPLPLTVPLC